MTFVPQIGPAKCKGPCEEVTLHETIRPVVRHRIFVRCLICGTVQSFPKE